VRDAVLTSVALADGLAVFASRDGACYALDAATGTLRWRTDVGSPVLSSPAVAGGGVLFGADDGLFRCLALADGRVLWSVDTTGDGSVISPDPRIQSSPAVGVEGQVVFGAANGHVYCLSPASASSAPAKAPAVAEAGRPSRLMHAADALVGGLVGLLAGWTGSPGAALLLAGAGVGLGLAPLSWAQARRLARPRAIEADFSPLHARHVTGSGHRRELARRLVDAGANPLAGLAIALVHMGVVVVVLLALQAGADLAGQRSLWIANLAAPDRLVRLKLAGGPVHVLPGVLAVSIWAFWWLARPAGAASSRGRYAATAVVAVAVAVLTWRWPAGMHLFALGLVGLAAVGARILRTMGNKTQAL
ncbi:MAG TPA: PQQ-binding-like beta-propeller repeat protein, partial [Phycisphaerae bacterium]|nr:PQQ-binding-like beta-propeller repeat protein [Phycisphaerae bacterium]